MSMRTGPSEPMMKYQRGFGAMASTIVVAQDLATSERYFSLTLVTQPALMINSARLQLFSFFNSSS
jgi:hypothetical protein